MNDNNNIYCIVVSSFALQLSFKLQYDFGAFLYDTQVGKDTTSILTGNNSGSHTNGGDGKRIVFERKSFVLFAEVGDSLGCATTAKTVCLLFFLRCVLGKT